MINLDYLYDRILGGQGDILPGEGQNLTELMEHAGAWSSELARITGDLTEAAETFEGNAYEDSPVVYLTEENRKRLVSLLQRAAELTDDAVAGQLTDLAYDTWAYTSRMRAAT